MWWQIIVAHQSCQLFVVGHINAIMCSYRQLAAGACFTHSAGRISGHRISLNAHDTLAMVTGGRARSNEFVHIFGLSVWYIRYVG